LKKELKKKKICTLSAVRYFSGELVNKGSNVVSATQNTVTTCTTYCLS
jgi:hypothetical protein